MTDLEVLKASLPNWIADLRKVRTSPVLAAEDIAALHMVIAGLMRAQHQIETGQWTPRQDGASARDAEGSAASPQDRSPETARSAPADAPKLCPYGWDHSIQPCRSC